MAVTISPPGGPGGLSADGGSVTITVTIDLPGSFAAHLLTPTGRVRLDIGGLLPGVHRLRIPLPATVPPGSTLVVSVLESGSGGVPTAARYPL